MKTPLRDLLAQNGGILRSRDHPELVHQLDWLRRTGAVVGVLPGILAVPEVVATVEGRVAAAMVWRPGAVVTGRTAARLSFWPSLPAPVLELAQVKTRQKVTGFAVSGRLVPPELVLERGPLRLSDPALTALDLCLELGGDPIDTALRTRATTLAGLRRALELCPDRTGNRRRRELLLDSRDAPWSRAERDTHRLLRENGVTGWETNAPVLAGGRRYVVDLLFRAARLVVEIDGREFHTDAAAFEADRHRQNALVAAGWRVLRVTWRMVCDEPEQVLRMISAELRRAARSGAGQRRS